MTQCISLAGCGKVPMAVIPNEVRNLSGFENQKKEKFLGTQSASE